MKLVLTGLTIKEAKAKIIELCEGEQNVPPGLMDTVDNFKLTNDGVILDAVIETVIEGDPTDQLSDEAKHALINQDLENGVDLVEAVSKHYGPEPEYNGVVGDSHDCPACNYRRKLEGVDLTTDMLNGLTPDEAKEEVKKGYAKTGRLVPNEAKLAAGAAKVAREKNLEMVQSARKRIVQLFGEGSQELKDFDGMVEAYKAGDANAEAMAKLDSLRAKVFALI